MLVMGEGEHLDRARNAGRSAAHDRGVERQRLAGRVEEHGRDGLRWRDLLHVEARTSPLAGDWSACWDGIAPLQNGEWIASHIQGAALHVYEGGHAFFIQDTRALPEIAAFLSGQTDSSAA